MEWIIAFVLLILLFAFVGFINTIMWFFRSPATKTVQTAPKAPNLSDDVKAATRLLAYLRNRNEIDGSQFQSIQSFLEKRFSNSVAALKQVKRRSTAQQWPADLAESNLDDPGLSKPKSVPDPIQDEIEFLPPRVRPTREAVPATEFKNDSPEKPVAKPTPKEVLVESELVLPLSAKPHSSSAPGKLSRPAPWDLPDPPAKPPRRSFGEMMSGFMQEKNMRWGELTSGILIVLSAVGLVLSLREELRNTIPYFSALLFMLITAAIHGAGAYTLKKWKLRNTSRGTLIIGLLLVPLNFVAACILASGEQQRSLDDPWLWIAIGTGVVAFSTMTWWSSKFLLRKFNLPLTIGIMGCGIGTLAINRLAESAVTSSGYLLYSLPVLASFLIGVCFAVPNQWERQKWSSRSANRMFLYLGVCAFALLASLGLVLIRTEHKAEGTIALTPIFSLVFLVTAWVGSAIRRGAIGPVPKSHGVAGLSLKILGLVMLVVSLASSLANPTVFAVNAIVSSLAMVVMFIHQRQERLLPLALSVLACGVLACCNLIWGKLTFDGWANAAQLGEAAINGKSGLCLMASGALIAVIHAGLGRFIKVDDKAAFEFQGWATAVGIGLIGCIVALVASFVNPDNVFDVTTATSLLSIAGLGLMLVSVFYAPKLQVARKLRVDIFASVFLILALAHAFMWNKAVIGAVESFTGGIVGSWLQMFALASFLFVGASIALQWIWKRNEGTGKLFKSATTNYLAIGAVATLVLSLGSLILVPAQAGYATGFQVFATLGWLAIGWVLALQSGLTATLRAKSEPKTSDLRNLVGWPLAVSLVLLVGVAVAELGPMVNWYPGLESPKHWLIQVCAISIWLVCWMILGVGFDSTRRLSWISKTTVGFERYVLAGLLIVMTLFAGDSLLAGSIGELVNENSIVSKFSIESEMAWGYSALGILAIATIVSLLFSTSIWMGAALLAMWLLAWSFGAVWFDDSNSMASAVRWLLPIGGLLGAILASTRRKLFPVWSGLRNQLSLSGSSRWESAKSQRLIDALLAIVTVVVLLISTVTVSRVLIGGVESLGGPATDSWFKMIGAEVSFGLPIFMVISTFLVFTISERRSELATLGSLVLQYIVVLAVVLLFVSPHPKLASTWFVGILQAVSLAMSGYGLVWYWTKSRIERGGESPRKSLFNLIENPYSQIETHTLINGLLVTSLAALVIGRFFFYPNLPGDWISSVGNTLGIVSWSTFGCLAYCVWHERLMKRSVSTWSWLVGWMGMVFVALIAAIVDHNIPSQTGLAFQVITVGALVVALAQFALSWVLVPVRDKTNPLAIELTSGYSNANSTLVPGALPSLLIGCVGLAFAIRGALMSPDAFWFYFGVIALLSALTIGVGCLLRSSILGFASAGMIALMVSLLMLVDPQSWFDRPLLCWFNLVAIGWSVLATGWTLFYVGRRNRGEQIDQAFMRMPKAMLLLGALWIFLPSVLELGTDVVPASVSILVNPLGLGAAGAIVCLSVFMVAVDRVPGQIASWCLLSLGLAAALANHVTPQGWVNFAGLLTVSFTVAGWGIAWANRKTLGAIAKPFRPAGFAELQDKAAFRLPIYSILAGSAVMMGVVWMLGAGELEREKRYLVSMVPFVLAVGFGLQSNQLAGRWMQQLTLCLITFGSLLVAWSDIPNLNLFGNEDGVRMLMRSMIVLAGAMSIYGGLVPRWVRAGDTWLKSLREMAVATCLLSVACFGLLLANEVSTFQAGNGCGLMITEAITVGVLVVGMILGLIMIAIRPENDPFALPMSGRMAYVYVAELITCGLLAHVYLTMPWLFQSFVGQYWPFIMMAICFAGVGVAQLLEQRNLKVLGGPLFNTAAALPVLVAIFLFIIGSKADTAIVILAVGMIYLLISFVKRSVLSGAAAVLFGNFALWVFFHRTPGLSYIDHPQLWLIPPAISTLVASHFSRNMLKPEQLGVIRYVCVAVIYLSSTIEIFIVGIGDSLWPPVLLAIFSVIGIMSGIMLRIKSFLYFGSLFLLMAMITMVAHAQQRLDHVWPWWAFGVAFGLAILVMFGLFEKRKKEMNAIATQLNDWEV